MKLSPDHRTRPLVWELHGDPVGGCREPIQFPAVHGNGCRMRESPADADAGRRPGDGQRARPAAHTLQTGAPSKSVTCPGLVTGIDFRTRADRPAHGPPWSLKSLFAEPASSHPPGSFGKIAPSRTKSGIRSSGASTVIVCLPSKERPPPNNRSTCLRGGRRARCVTGLSTGAPTGPDRNSIRCPPPAHPGRPGASARAARIIGRPVRALFQRGCVSIRKQAHVEHRSTCGRCAALPRRSPRAEVHRAHHLHCREIGPSIASSGRTAHLSPGVRADLL